LAGLIGRQVASAKGASYSRAMRSLGGTWTQERLDEFLRQPAAMVPGTTMSTEGIADDAVRSEIIRLIGQLK
jgi:cytochrome c